MKSLVSLLVALFMLVLVSSSALAATSLYGFMPGGALGGGVRLDLKPGVVTDLSVTAGSGSSGSTYSLYGDIFWGNWGVGVTAKKASVTADLAFDVNLQYAVERAITDDVIAGVAITIINYDTTSRADPNITLMPAIGPYFVLTI